MLRRRIIASVVLLFALFAVPTWAQVLDQVPADAMAVVKIKNLQATSDIIGQYAEAWGLTQEHPEAAKPLDTLLKLAALGPGLNRTGEAAVAVMPVSKEQHEPDVVGLIPVADYKAFIASLPNNKTEGAVTTFNVAEQQLIYVAQRGAFAAVSPKKELVVGGKLGFKAPAASTKLLASRDVIAYLNFEPVRKLALPELQKGKEMAIAPMMEGFKQMPGFNPKLEPIIGAAVTQVFTVLEGFLRETDGLALGVNITKDGLATVFAIEFNPSSYIGKAMASMKNTDASLTAGLPDRKYAFFGGSVNDPVTLQMLNDFLAPIEKEIKAMGADAQPVIDILAAMRVYFGAFNQASYGLLAPSFANIPTTGLFQVVSVMHGDAAKIKEAEKKMMASQNALLTMMGMDKLGFKVTVTQGAREVEGVKIDQTHTGMDPNNANPMQQQMQGMMMMFYGPKGAVMNSAVIGNNRVVNVMGGDDLVTDSIRAAKTNADPMGKGVLAAVNRNLPQNRLAAIYVPVDNIMGIVLEFMAQRGVAGVQMAPNLAPLGFTIATEGAALRIDGYFPAETIKATISAGMQLYFKSMPGNQTPPNPNKL